jgi:hypothetical protein
VREREISTSHTEARAFNSICQGERWERVDCKLKQRRVVLQKYSYTSHAACVLLQLASDMSHCPSMLINATQALLRVFYSPALVQANQRKNTLPRAVKNLRSTNRSLQIK